MGQTQAVKRFHVVACHVLWRELCYYTSQSPNVFNFHYLKKGLHDTPDLLRQQLQEAVDAAPEESDAVLVGYGLCSNGLVGIRAQDVPLVVMRGHDCITFLLGSKERYRDYFDRHPGTYWYSPGWIDQGDMPGEERYAAALKAYTETYGEENAEYLMRMEQQWISNYSNAAYVDLGFGDTQPYKEFTEECARHLGWDCDILSGSPRLMVDFVNGNWTNEDFLVVNPGEMVVASHDESVIAAKPHEM